MKCVTQDTEEMKMQVDEGKDNKRNKSGIFFFLA